MVVFNSWLVLPLGAATLLIFLDAHLKMSIVQVLLHIEAQVDAWKIECDKDLKGTKLYHCSYLEFDTCQTGQVSYASDCIRTLSPFPALVMFLFKKIYNVK